MALGRSLGGTVLSACLLAVGGCSSGGSGNACSITGVGVLANPTSVAATVQSALTATVTSTGTCAGGVTWSATPSGGTLTPTGLTATFSAATAQTYTVKATSTDDASKFGSATVTVTAVAPTCGTPNGTTITHSSNITADETWAGGGTTHAVPNSIHVEAPATLTIEPCALVSLGSGVVIYVNGVSGGAAAKLLAAGTDANNFVSFLPANPAQPWGYLEGLNEQSFIELHFTQLISGGAGGNFSRYSPLVAYGPGFAENPIATVTVDTVAVANPVGGAVFLESNATFTPASTILGVAGASDYSVALDMMALGSVPQYDDLGGNAHDDVLVIGNSANIFGDLTITNHMPVRIVTASMTVAPGGPNSSLSAVTLTVQAGAEIRFAKPVPGTPGARVYFGTVGQGASDKSGTLIAVGDTAPILFTSGEETKAAGDWSGLFLLTAVGSQLNNVTVEYAGAFSGIVSANCKPTGDNDFAGIIVGSDGFVPSADLIQNSTIQHNAGFGIDAIWTQGGGVFNSPDLSGSNTFSDNLYCAQSYNGVTGGSCPTGGGCTAP